jgi:hypothetical protein
MNIGEFPPEMGWSLNKGLSKENTNSYDPTNLADIIDKMNIKNEKMDRDGGVLCTYMYIYICIHMYVCVYVYACT